MSISKEEPLEQCFCMDHSNQYAEAGHSRHAVMCFLTGKRPNALPLYDEILVQFFS